MPRMLERIAPVLLVSVMAGGFVIMSSLPATAEMPNDQIEPPHGVRPTAALNAPLSAELSPEWLPVHAVTQILTADDWEFILAQVEAEAAAAAAAAAPAYRSGSSSSRHGGCNGDVDCFLACTRSHESDTSGGYGAVSSGGSYRGAYQFQQSTWDAAVAGAGYDQYAGVPADQVPAEVQDAAAAHLYSVSGTRPWGGRC